MCLGTARGLGICHPRMEMVSNGCTNSQLDVSLASVVPKIQLQISTILESTNQRDYPMYCLQSCLQFFQPATLLNLFYPAYVPIGNNAKYAS